MSSTGVYPSLGARSGPADGRNRHIRVRRCAAAPRWLSLGRTPFGVDAEASACLVRLAVCVSLVACVQTRKSLKPTSYFNISWCFTLLILVSTLCMKTPAMCSR